MSTPIVLSSSTTVLPGTTGIFDAGALSHPARRPMLIRSLLFTAQLGGLGLGSITLGGSLRMSLRVGPHQITARPTPLYSFGRDLQWFDVTADGVAYTMNRFLWVPKKPIFVPPGMSILASVSREATDGLQDWDASAAAKVRVTLNAITLGDRAVLPREIEVPYIASWVDTSGTPGGKSQKLDLCNPFPIPLDVHYFTGHVRYFTGSDEFDRIFNLPEAGKVSIVDNNNFYLVREPTPMGIVFDAGRYRTFPVNRAMAPNDYYIVSTSLVSSSAYSPIIGLVGSRKERA